ncbi:hypothetical protein Tco_1151115 [Tanacetum coccineum]
MMSLFRSDSKYSDMFKEFESGGASRSGGCGDDEESGDDEDGDGDDCDDITDYVDYDQEDGKLPDLPTFSATNEFSSVCEQGEENIDVNTTQEL